MRAMITGACGFVGGHLVREMTSAGYEVLATDIMEGERAPEGGGGVARAGDGKTDEGYSSPGFPEGVVYRRCDLLSPEAVGELVNWYRPGVLVHLAAQSSAAKSFEDPKGTLETNLFCTLNILEAIRRVRSADGGRARILSIGSSEEYGARSADEMPLTEQSPVEPVSPYAVSKAAQGILSLQYSRSYDLEVIVTRSFAHTGPGQADRFVLPSFAKQCAQIKLGIRKPVIRVGNLDVVRDFLDVRDVVRAYRLLVENGFSGEIYNVCSGKGLRLEDALYYMIKEVPVKVSVEVASELLRPADVPVMIGSNEKLCRDTGWEVGIPIERMLEDLMKNWELKVTDSIS